MTPSQGNAAFQGWIESHFLGYQQSWIFDDADVAYANKGRQLGYSDGTAGKIVRRGFFQRRPQIFISATQRHAEELIQTVKTHCQMLAALGCRAACDFNVDNTQELRWRTGGRVLALSSSARTGRSYHGDLYFDEFAYHENPEKLWAAAAPMATREGWKINVVSTPNGAQGLFYEWCEVAPPAGWSYHRVPLDVALADGLAVDRAKLFKLVGYDDRMFAEAYLCQFVDGQLQYLPHALVKRAWLNRTMWAARAPRLGDVADLRLFGGLDVGRHHDLTVLTIVALAHGVAWVIAIMTCKRTAFDEQFAMIRDARRVFPWESLHVDAGGLGENLAEQLVAAWGDHAEGGEVEALKFSQEVKADLATRTLRWFRDNRVRLPPSEQGIALRGECTAIRRIVTDKGSISYDAPRTSKGHADRFWSMALALRGAGEPISQVEYGQEPLMMVA